MARMEASVSAPSWPFPLGRRSYSLEMLVEAVGMRSSPPSLVGEGPGGDAGERRGRGFEEEKSFEIERRRRF